MANAAGVVDSVIPPPIQSTELVLGEAWLFACEKLGHDPLEFQGYKWPPGLSDAEELERIAEVQAAAAWEEDQMRRQNELATERLLGTIDYARTRIRRALGLTDECNEWCCRG